MPTIEPPSRATAPPVTLPTPINVNFLSEFLEGFKSKNFIMNGFTSAFSQIFKGEDVPLVYNNSCSPLSKPDVITKYIEYELDRNRINGPFVVPPLENFKCFQISLIEKKLVNFV